MAVNHKTLRDNLTAKDFNYRAGFYSLKNNLVNTSDCFPFRTYSALQDINDIRTNNYSNLFLSKKDKAENWLDYTKKEDDFHNVVTTLSFFSSKAYNETNPGVFLYFNKNYEFWDIYLTSVDYTLTSNRPEETYYNYIFYIEFLDDIHCRISHNFGDMKFYLTVDESKNISFTKSGSAPENDTIFIYNLEKTYLILYKRIETNVYAYKEVVDAEGNIVYDEDGNPLVEIDEDGTTVKKSILSLRCDTSEDTPKLVLSENLEDGDDNIFLLNYEDFNFDLNVNASWIGYDRAGAIDTINNGKSSFNLDNQFLFHHQYNADGEINFIPLKNNLTYKSETVRGNNLVESGLNVPDVNFRNYTSISSGISQEKGSDNITLNFTFNDQTFTVKDGEELSFFIPSPEDNENIEPLWPYRFININDTKFVKNGSFSSDVPYFADKIRCLQNIPFSEKKLDEIIELLQNELGEYLNSFELNDPNVICWLYATPPEIVREFAKKGTVVNGSYLCTWLYKRDEDSEAIWLDRYYYPDFITRTAALIGKENLAVSLENVFEKDYHLNDEEKFNDYNDEDLAKVKAKMRKSIFQNTYFDKRSDFVIQPGRTYTYSRLSSKMVENVLSSLEPKRIPKVQDRNYVEVELKDDFKFDGKNFLKIPHEALSDTNEINLNFDIYLDAKKRMGIQLVGSDYKNGFNIQNRRDVAPFHYIADDNCVYMVNNDFSVQRKIDLFELYGDNVIRYVLGDIFDDVVVFTSSFLYILSYDLALKAKIAYEDIDGIRTILVANGGGSGEQNILNYPYTNYKCDVERNIKDSGSVEYSFDPNAIKSSFTRAISPYAKKSADSDIFTDRGSVEIVNRVTEVLTAYDSVLYKGNLYIPFYHKIIKLVFIPDVEADAFTVEERQKYPCKARVLDPSEYFLNYIPADYSLETGETWKESVSGVENEFIEIENIIKSIYISESGKIYGMNYDRIALSGDRDTIYGLYAKESYTNSGGWWWLFNQSLSKMEANQDTSKYAEFASTNSIDLVRFNEDNYMAMVRNFNTKEISNASDGNKRLDIYDKTKERVYTYDMTLFDECLCLDSYNTIDQDGTEHSVFVCLAKYLETLYRIQYHVDEEKIVVEELTDDFPYEVNRCFREMTNCNSIMRYADRNALYFNLFVPSSFIYDYVATIKWNLQDIQTGWYNINVAISLDNAEFIVKINDVEHGRISFQDGENSWFLPYVNSDASVFATNIYFAKTPKRYGTTMGEILSYEPDPYIAKNTKIENASFFRKKLAYNEYQAVRLEGKKINPLILTLPCGQRNAIEEIVRYFKYNATSSISNTVKINISGLRDIIDDNNIAIFKNELLTVLNERKEATVKIADIEFVD